MFLSLFLYAYLPGHKRNFSPNSPLHCNKGLKRGLVENLPSLWDQSEPVRLRQGIVKGQETLSFLVLCVSLKAIMK